MVSLPVVTNKWPHLGGRFIVPVSPETHRTLPGPNMGMTGMGPGGERGDTAMVVAGSRMTSTSSCLLIVFGIDRSV